MNELYFSTDERCALLSTIFGRVSHLERILLMLDPKADANLIELYKKELLSLESVLFKLGYVND